MEFDFTKLLKSQFAVVACEIETGIILDNDFKRYVGNGECYKVFNSYEKAEQFCVIILKQIPSIEFTIFSQDNTIVKIINGKEVMNHIDIDNALVLPKKKKWDWLGIFKKNKKLS